MLLCLGEPPVSFLVVRCWLQLFIHFLIIISFLIFICRCSSFTFAFRHHPSPFRGLSPGFYTHFILSAQPIAEWFAKLSFSTIPLSSYLERYGFEWAFFTHRRFLPYGPSPTFWLRFSSLPWEPAVLPWSLQVFILILETQTQHICLFDSK